MSTRSNDVVTTCVSRSRENDTMSLERFWIWRPRVCRAVWPCCWICTLIPAVVEPALEARQVAVRLVDEMRDVALEMADLGADRLRQQHPDSADDRESRQVHEQDREPAREPDPVQQPDDRIQDQRDRAGREQDQQHGAGRPRQRPQSEDGEREHDELDPARNDDRRRRNSGMGDPRPRPKRRALAVRRLAQPLGIGTLAALVGGGRNGARSPGELQTHAPGSMSTDKT